jgi:YD repeat-containing protein
MKARMTPPVESRRLAIPLAVLLVSSLILFTALAGGTGKDEDCRGNSSKKPCPAIEPAEGATVRGTVHVRATVQQDNATVAGITFEVDGDPIAAEDTTAPYELDWDTTRVSNGKHGLTAEIRLADGSTSTGRNELSVDNPTPDTTAPTAQLTAPTTGSTVSGSVDVAATAGDNVGVTGVQFKLDGANLGGEDTSAPYSAAWNTTTSTNAIHTLVAVARDAAGNTTTTSATSVTVKNSATTPPAPSPDTTAPSAQLTAPSTGSTVSGSVNLAANASDNVGVAGVQFKLDGANLGAEDTSAPYALAWDSRTTSNAQHTLTAVARDAAGNRTTAANVTVTVSNTTTTTPPADTTAPTTQLTAPSAGSTVNSSINVTANASDNVGVAGVQFKLDGANLGAEDTSAPYSVAWDTKTASNAQHVLTAVARDAAGNKTTANNVTVTVNNVASQPPTSSSLRWAAPQLTSPQTILIPERGGDTWSLEAGKDYVIKFQTGRRYGPLRFWGGRNLVLVGGQQVIDDTSSSDYRARRLLEFRDQTGIIHIEGYHGTGAGLTEGINIWAPNAILQIQKSRIDNVHGMSNNTSQHPDIIQTWSGPREVRIWKFTGMTDYQGFLFMRDSGGVYPATVTLDEVNIRPLPNPSWGGKGEGINAIWFISPSTEFRLRGVWVETGWWNGTYHKGLKDSLGFRDPNVTATCWSWQEFRSSATAYGGEHIAEPCNTGSSYTNQQGDWIEFVRSSTDNIWNYDKSGRGRVYQGNPSGGDFVSASSVGTSYTP